MLGLKKVASEKVHRHTREVACIHALLHALATKPYEISGLSTLSESGSWFLEKRYVFPEFVLTQSIIMSRSQWEIVHNADDFIEIAVQQMHGDIIQ